MATQESPILEGYWYPVLPSTLLRNRAVNVSLWRDEIVLWREGEQVHALASVCAHMCGTLGAQVEGSRVQCGLHRMWYNNEGQGVETPFDANARPEDFRVPIYHAVIAAGYVFIWTGIGEPGPVPVVPEYRPWGMWIQDTFPEVQCSWETLLEGFFDMTHGVTHSPGQPQGKRSRQGQSLRDLSAEIALTPTGFILTSPPEVDEPLLFMSFDLPNRVTIKRPGGFTLVCYFTPLLPSPEGKARCRLDWMSQFRGTRWLGEEHSRVAEHVILKEDIENAEIRQRRLDAGAAENLTPSDSAISFMREVLYLAKTGRWQEGSRGLRHSVTFQFRG